MKKQLFLMMAMFVTVSLVACGENNQEPSQDEEIPTVVVNEQSPATLTITLIDGKIDNGLWSWVDFWSTTDSIMFEAFSTSDNLDNPAYL